MTPTCHSLLFVSLLAHNTVMGLNCLLLASAKVMDCGNSEAIDQLSLKETQRSTKMDHKDVRTDTFLRHIAPG